MRDSYAVLTAELAQHSRTLGGLQAEVGSASETAAGTSVTDDAYGETCQEFPAILRQLAQAGQATLEATATAFEEATADMKATATTYDEREVEAKSAVASAAAGLESA
jgi:hypothetical protein